MLRSISKGKATATAVGAVAGFALLVGGASAVSGSDVLTTLAGNGVAGYSGDGGQATSAQLNAPIGVAVDTAGNLYVADQGNNRIRKVTPGGTITTVAGTGVAGYSGDGGQATSAQLKLPFGVAVDGDGNLYVADSGNSRVRKVSTSGIITTIAGTGIAGYSGDGGQGTSAQVNQPGHVAVDGAGNVYIADTGNHRIRKVASNGNITTVAGNGTGGSSGDGGQATSAQLDFPVGMAVDGAGNLYIADFSANRIRRVSSGGTISTIAGNGTAGFSGDGGPATSAQLKTPYGVAVDAVGNLYIADTFNHRIRKVTSGGTITTIAGSTPGFGGDGGPASAARLNLPGGVAVDRGGSLYISDHDNNRARKITNTPPTASFTATPESGQAPLTVALDASGSSDPDGSITLDAWTFGDGHDGTGKTESHTYATAGTYTVKLTVTDDSGASASAQKTITVTAAPAPQPAPAPAPTPKPPPTPALKLKLGGAPPPRPRAPHPLPHRAATARSQPHRRQRPLHQLLHPHRHRLDHYPRQRQSRPRPRPQSRRRSTDDHPQAHPHQESPHPPQPPPHRRQTRPRHHLHQSPRRLRPHQTTQTSHHRPPLRTATVCLTLQVDADTGTWSEYGLATR